jgi:hypothetical protein
MASRKVGRTDFRCEPSAVAGQRYNVAIETAVAPFVRFGAVLTRRELLALIDCLGVGLKEGQTDNDRTRGS